MSSDPTGAGRPAPGLPCAVVAVATDAFCYGPLVDRLDPATLAGSERAQRWSDAGAPTVYLASDIGVALAEWGRHVPVDEGREPSGLWRVPVRLERAADLRRLSPAGVEGLARLAGIADPPWPGGQPWVLDAALTREVAAWLRYASGVDGLLVPSVAFLDDPGRGNLVVFVPDDEGAAPCIGEPSLVAAVEWRDRAPASADLDTRVQVRAAPVLGRV